MHRLPLLFFVLFSGFYFTQEKLPIIPYPQEIKVTNAISMKLENSVIYAHDNKSNADYLQGEILKRFGLKLPISTKPKQKANGIHLIINKKLNSDYYELKSTQNEVQIIGKTEKEIFYGLQTLLQIIKERQKGKFEIPAVSIKDHPKFDYRGMHLDVSRHFFSVEEVKKYLDYLAMYKYNTFHWHLTDDQGWRIEIKKFFKLTQIGAWREGSQVGAYSDQKFDDQKYGGFYTQDEIREVVSYAKKLHINVIPEIEMPGHSVAAIASYPELSCYKGDFKVSKRWGVEENILCPKEETFKFLEEVIDEIVELFPYEYIHIGGDEAPKKAWKESVFVQKRIQELGLKNEQEMQSYFIKRMETYINSKGKKIIGWNEILEGGLAPNATVMSWTGIEGGVQAAKTKHKAIMTPTSSNYFDYYQGNPETEPIAIGGNTPLKKVYDYQVIPAELNEEESKYIWGTQGNLWTEYIQDFSHVEHMIFPRMMALSEVAWGSSEPEHYNDFERRVTEHFKILDKLKIRYSKAIFEVSSSISQNDSGQIYYSLRSAKPNNWIRYTTDGSAPTATSKTYEKPVFVNKSMLIQAAVFENNQKISAVNSHKFDFSKSTGKKIRLEHPPAEAYSVGGDLALVDGVSGDLKNHGKYWLGFSGKDCTATIDLGDSISVSNFNFGFYDRPGSWIYPPIGVKIFSSEDGVTFSEIATHTFKELAPKNGKISVSFNEQKARYIRVNIQNLGIIPDGKEGAGNPAWLFIDEISIH